MWKIVVVFCGYFLCSLGAYITYPLEPSSGARIVGGYNATINDFPYQVSIQTYGGHSCGGSLYKRTVIITAAHCLRGVEVKELSIRAGSTNHNRGGFLVNVSHFKIHPDFDTKTKFNDIALIFLETPLSIGSTIQTIDLASSIPLDGTPGIVSGWGTESFYNKDAVPENLKYANLKVVSRENCMSEKYAYGNERIFPNMICAAGNGVDSCQGDSGGPFVVDGRLAGVISWGFGCAETMFPGVYSNIPLFIEWIENNVN